MKVIACTVCVLVPIIAAASDVPVPSGVQYVKTSDFLKPDLSVVTCPVCDGTGKKKTAGDVRYEPAATSRPEAVKPAAPPATYRERYQPRRRVFRRGR